MDVDLGIFLVDDMLVKTDRASMANSLEARVPFLDPVVSELALALPSRLKVRPFATKRIRYASAERTGTPAIGMASSPFERAVSVKPSSRDAVSCACPNDRAHAAARFDGEPRAPKGEHCSRVCVPRAFRQSKSDSPQPGGMGRGSADEWEAATRNPANP